MTNGRSRSRTGVHAAIVAVAIAGGLGAGAAGASSADRVTIQTDDTAPPVTTHALDPAGPGAGGTYTGPVEVTLSATDPAEGAPAPEIHDVNAAGQVWDPSTLDIAFGDVVRWNFPADTAGFPHDVWVIEPGEAPDSAGTQVTPGVVSPGGPPASRALDVAGTWTYVCKLHSFVQGGRWQGMVGTAVVGADPGPGTASGVDFTEYRVNTDGAIGQWVRSDNAAGDRRFETSFTVSGEGDHVVEYRSTDNAVNREEIRSVGFSITGEATTTPPAAIPQPGGGLVITPPPTRGGDAVKPAVSRVKLKALRRAVRVRFRLSEPATVTVRVKRRGSRKVLKSTRVQARAGTRTVTLRSKRLRKGRYTVEIQARDAFGNRSTLAAKRLTLRT